MADIQRARLLSAMGQAACERGGARVTVADVVGHAGVSRRTFYEIFTDTQDCLLAALNAGLEQAEAVVREAWTAQDASWRERVRGALVALLGLFDEDPVLARLLLVESLFAGGRALEQRTRVLNALIDAVDQAPRPVRRQPASGPVAAPASGPVAASASGPVGTPVVDGRLTAEAVVGGAVSVLQTRLTSEQPSRLLDLTGPLMSMIVLPYLGPAAARQELARATPAAPVEQLAEDGHTPALSARTDPLKVAGLRLTYRTMRVLDAVAESPGASNRRIGAIAEVTDQGQISKLLSRLERHGLIENDGKKRSQGEPNSWVLTQTGEQVIHSIRAHLQSATGETHPE